MSEPQVINPFAEPILQQDFAYVVTTENDPTPRYSASSLAFCIVQCFYKKQGTHQVENRDFISDCRMDVGNAIHEVIQKRVQMRHPDAIMELEVPDIQIDPVEIKDELGEEPRFTEPVFCSGRPDIFVPCKSDPDLSFVVEIKSGTAGLLKGGVPGYHAAQGAAYWRSLDVDWVYFYQVDRGSIAHTYKHFTHPEEHWRDVLRTINTIEGHIAEGTVPNIPSHISKHRVCTGCGYFYKCYPSG